MPLSKARMRERKRIDRVKPMSNLTDGICVKPNIADKLRESGLIMEGNTIKGIHRPFEIIAKPRIPLYNPLIHSAGDTVRLKSGEIVTVPDLDADGHMM